MISSRSSQPAKTAEEDADRARIEPQLKDLMSLHRPASLLPSWSRSIRANQSGGYLSALKGRGMEYDESRPYQAGDDIRTLDWRVTARTGKPHTKLFREERERPVYVCSDLSGSMRFATRGVFKSVQAARAGALIAWKAQQSGDRVGGLVFSDSAHEELQPERGKPGVIRLLKQFVAVGAFGESPRVVDRPNTLANTAARLTRIVKPGSLIFLLSDFRDLDDTIESNIASLARHNDTTLVFISDPFEANLPQHSANARVTDGSIDLDIGFGSNEAHSRYATSFTTRVQRVEKLCRDFRIRLGQMQTTDEPLTVLQRALGSHRP